MVASQERDDGRQECDAEHDDARSGYSVLVFHSCCPHIGLITANAGRSGASAGIAVSDF
jgi:hypothetical protein